MAWRLAKFNISTNQADSFRGVPSPAAGLVVASFPLIIFYQYFNLQTLFINPWLLYAVILLLAFLMLSNRRFLALKFKSYSLADNRLNYLLLVIAVLAIVFLKWLAVPVIFFAYLAVSFFTREPSSA